MLFDYVHPVFRINREERGIWRYSTLLPKVSAKISLGEGLTPLVNLDGVLIKNEKNNPTGSYADRASAVIASYLRSLGAKYVFVEYVPDFTRSLIYYLRDIEAKVVVDSILEVELEDAILFAKRSLELVRSPSDGDLEVSYVNPLTVEGLKTIVFELYESGVNVDYIVVPAETGLLALSLYKGLKDLESAGVDFSCEIVAVKVKGSSARLLEGLKLDGLKVIEVSEEEAYQSLRELVKKGLKVRPIVALSYNIAKTTKNAVAIVTMGFRPPSRAEKSAVKRVILEVLAKKQPLTAYQIWKENPSYTLRAVYKAVKHMETKGDICYEVVSRGKRKIKLYRLCQQLLNVQ